MSPAQTPGDTYLQLDVQGKARPFPLFLLLVGSENLLLSFTTEMLMFHAQPELGLAQLLSDDLGRHVWDC